MITSDLYKVKVMSNKTIELKINTAQPLHGVPSGGTVKVEVDRDGIPFDRDWRRRLKDSVMDGCVEIVTAPKKKKESK